MGKEGYIRFWLFNTIVAEEYINEAEKKVATIQQLREEMANQSDAPKYTLDDDSDEEIETSARIAEVKIVKIEELRNICKIYSAKLETTTGPVPRFIAVGANMILCLKSHPTCTCFLCSNKLVLGYAVILWQRTLRQLVRLAYHRDNQNLLTFVIKGYPNTLSYEPGTALLTAPTFEEKYLMEDAKECIKVIQEENQKLRKK